MENEEIMLAEEIEEVATLNSGRGWKIAAGVGAAALVGGLIYKFVAKPVIAKIKARKNQDEIVVEAEAVEED